MPSADVQSKLAALSPEQRQQLKRLLEAKRGVAGAELPAPGKPRPAPEERIQRSVEADDYPLSFAQKRLWLQEQLMEGKSAPYNLPLAVSLRGEFSVEALEQAFRAVIERHAVLRTRFGRSAGEPRQQIRASFPWAIERWTLPPGREAEVEFRRRAETFARQPFALEHERPIRVACGSFSERRHGLVMVLHHVACDGGSVPLLLADLDRFYRLAVRREPVTPEPLPLRYVDFAVWHRAWVETPAAGKARAYWLRQFAELPEPLDLPADFPRPPVQDFSGAHAHVLFDRTTRDRLGQLGQSVGASLFMTLHAVVAVFLHRYAGQDDVTIGVPTSGRQQRELEPLVGFFVNTLALRTRMSAHEPFRAVLERVRDSVLDAFEHQGYPFDVLVDALPLQRDLSRPPLFNVMMGLNRAEEEAFRLGEIESEPIPLGQPSSKVDLTFHFVETAAGLELDLEYATALFTEARMRRVADYFSTLLAGVLADPRAAVGDLELMPAAQTRALIAGFNPPAREFPGERSLAELFREQVERNPDGDAVFFGGRAFSYAEIDQWSDAIAAHLTARFGPLRCEEPIALQIERSERMIAALLGILKAGGCYLPINPGTPAERIRTMLDLAGARVRLVEDPAPLPGWTGTDVDLRTWLTSPPPAMMKRIGGGGARALAYIMFTSGSTGGPKGVLIEQRAVVRLVRNTDFLQLGPGDRVLQTGSLAFDASTFEIWGPLLNGGCCCLPEAGEMLEIDRFGALLEATGANTCFLTTGLFNQIADFHPTAFARLRNLLTGGEKVSVAHVNRVRAAAPALNLLHVYGPTENTTFSSWHRVASPVARDVPIGRAIAHSSLYILDARGNLLPPGVAGEIHCGGEGLARGYLDRADLTAERFVPDAFSGRPGARLYRTGDLGRWNDRGELEFLGRNDDQVKIRGYRIELGEIELRLRQLAAVQQAVVVARPAGGTHELIAYVVSADGAAATNWRAALAPSLPDYMMPAHFVLLEALPLNASGKVDRRALPAPESVGRSIEAAPEWQTPGERALAEVWGEVLGRVPAGGDAHYFNSGGDSIKAIQLTARLRARGYRLTLREVFSGPRFGELAAALAPEEPSTMPDAGSEEGEVPLTPIQHWFLATHAPPYDHFNQATWLDATERLDATALRRALETLIARHPMLRCRVQPDGASGWRQEVGPGGRLHWQEEDWRARAPGETRLALAQAARSLHESLSLSEGRLVAAGLFRCVEKDRLLLVIHHWAVDGISWRILLEDLEEIYRALATNLPLPAARGSASFRSWAQALHRFARSAQLATETRYWQTLADPEPGANGDLPRISESRRLTFPVEFTERILSNAHRAYGTQAVELLLAALSRAWEERSDDHLLLAMEGHGREPCVAPTDVSRTGGWFTSLWPLRLVARGDWPERIRTIRDALHQVPERGVGFGVLRYLTPRDAAAAGVPAVTPRVSFNYLGEFGEAVGALFRGAPELPPGEPVASHLKSAFDLDIVGEVTAGCLRLGFQFHRALFDAEDRSGFVADFERALQECVAHCLQAEPRRSRCDFTGGLETLEELDRLTRHCAERGLEIEDVLPLTPMQEGMVFHSCHEPESGAYSDQVILRLEGPLGREWFEPAWLALGDQYPNLRSVFVIDVARQPVAVISRGSRLGFSWAEVGPDEADVAALRRAERERGFDLQTGPLLRLTLVRRRPDCHEVIVGFHHSVLDGWSSGLLWERLAANYRAIAAGAPLPRVAASFNDYLRWLGARNAAQDRERWRKLLAGCPAGTAVPPGGPRLGGPPMRTRSTAWELGRARTDALIATARLLGVSENSLWQTLWGVFLGRLNQATDVVFGATLSGRSERVPHVEQIVGLLIHTVPVRVAWTPDTTLRALAVRVQAQLGESMETVGASLADIQNAVLERGALIHHVIVFENYPVSEEEDAGIWRMETVDIHDPMHFEFGLLVAPRMDGWLCRIVADSARYPDGYLRVLKNAWEEVIDACCRAPDIPIAAHPTTRMPDRARRVAVVATFTAEPVEDALAFWLEGLGYSSRLEFAPFNQVLQQLHDPAGALGRSKGDGNLLLVRLADWVGGDVADESAVAAALESNGDQLVDGLRRWSEAGGATFTLIVFCPAAAGHPQAALLAGMEERLLRRIGGIGRNRLDAVRAAELLARFGASDIDNPAADAMGAVPYTEAFFAMVGTEFVRRWEARTRLPLKVIALDADQTLWLGVLGEDGIEGLTLTPAHRRLQLAAKAAREQGRLLALVSKNNRDELQALFAARSDFPLRWNDFVAVEAGWRPKSESLRAIARTLNLGLDSFVFIDDSALECAEVQAGLPEVLTLQLPESAEAIERFVEHAWALDAAAETDEDRRRSELYRAEAQREEARRESGGLGDFLRQLQLEITLVPIDERNLARAAQLTIRTNQFNASTVRRSEEELRTFLRGADRRGFLVEVKDRFGAYGLTGGVLYSMQADAWKLDTFLLSCRVLGRGVEHGVLRRLAADAIAAGVEVLRIPFVRTGRNIPAEKFLRSCADRVEPAGVDSEEFVFSCRGLSVLEVTDSARAAPNAEAPAAAGARHDASWPAACAFHQFVATELSTEAGLLRAIADFRRGRHNRGKTAAYEPPRGNLETQVAAVWSDVLGVARVGRRDDFFSLGGHSLRAVMMLGRINREFHVALPIESVFAQPVLADFVRLITAARPATGEVICPAPDASDYPLSHAQRRLWMIEQMRGAGPSPFHMPAVFSLRGEFSAERLAGAFRRMIARHESLRTGIVLMGGEPRQVVWPQVEFAFEPLPGDAANGPDEAALAGFLERDFDLARPPLLRVGIHGGADRTWTLAVVMHHIVSDGWSIGVMAEELTVLYAGGEATLLPLPIHYRDYAVWQRGALAAGRLDAAAAYWKRALTPLPAALDLPSDRVRPSVKATRGAEVVETCSAAAWRELQRKAEREGLSPFMMLMAALQIVLARHARAERFVIGTPVAGRDQPELEPQIGFYVNLLPIVAEVDGRRRVREHLAQVKSSVVSALSHARYPFDRLVDDLNLPRDMSRAPVFDVLMVYQSNRAAELMLDGVDVRPLERASRTAQYDLTFDFAETPAGLRLRLEYDAALFDANRVTRIVRHVFTVLPAALAAPTATLASLDLRPPEERAAVLGFERGPRFGDYRGVCIHELVSRQAGQNPGRAAVIAGSRLLSYRALDERIRGIATAIRRAGIAPRSAVAVAGSRSDEFVAAMLGVMRAGCVYAPLELKHPDERLRLILDDGGISRGIAIGAEAKERLTGLGLSLVTPTETAVPEENDVAVSPEDLAYVIYTSGSTGRPKGVEVSHGAFATMIEAQIGAFGIEASDRCAWWASCAFDASLSEIFLALTAGATLIVAGETEREDPAAFRAWLRAQRVTVVTLPPVFLRLMNRANLEPVRVLITAGEAADPGDARHYARQLEYFNAYGPTETSVCATVHRVAPDTPELPAIPIGRPLAIAATYVLDEAHRRVPLGVPGELSIGGRLLARGYRNAPAVTAERFIEDPFAGEPGARMYRTGDLVRWRADGTLEFIGRADGQIKIRGFRVELGEVEAVLRLSPAVRDVAVVPSEWRGSLLLVAYVVGLEDDVATVREWVATRLPDYMRPSAYVCLERLPLNASGKLDQSALPPPEFGERQAVTAPATAPERALAEAWRECLADGRVGRESDFFALGGDSIRALTVLSRLRQRGWSLPLKAIFAHPRLRDQATQLAPAEARAARSVCGSIGLVPVQKWFLESHRDSPLHHFNQAVFYTTAARVDVQRLRRAVDAIWRRHAALRARFEQANGKWQQVIQSASAAGPAIDVLDPHGGSAAQVAARETAWVGAIQAGFELGRGPLVRYGIVRGVPADRVLCVTHHLVSDWVSHRILLEDLNTAYAAAESGECELVASGTELDEWIEECGRWAGARARDRQCIEAWGRIARSCAQTKSNQAAGRYGEVGVLSRVLDAETTRRIRAQLGARAGVGVRELLLAALARAEREVGGQPDVAVQLEGHGREAWTAQFDVSRTVGWFTCLYPFHTSDVPGEDWAAAVSRIHDGLAALPDSGLSYGLLRAEGGDDRLPEPATRIGFNYLGEFAAPADGAMFQMAAELPRDAISPRFERDHPLDVSAWIIDGELHVQIAFLEPHTACSEMSRWLDCVLAFLRAAAGTSNAGSRSGR